MLRKLVWNPNGHLRNGWWVLLFYVLLGIAVFALVMGSGENKVPELWQLGAVVLITAVIQWLRRRPFFEVTGRIDGLWLRQFALGAALGLALWGVTTAVLLTGGWTTIARGADPLIVVASLLPLVSAAVLEEMIFRGVVFQRIRDGLGPVLALLLTSVHFVLVHMNNPAMTGTIRIIAMLNIFVASLAFGLAYLRTGSLALPIGLHVFANVVQGPVLGFGVSGTQTPHMLTQHLTGPEWLTGGAFGLEASVPGTIGIALVAWLIWKGPVPSARTETKPI